MTGSNNQITLTWSPVQDLTSGIDHYAIYRDGSLYATSTTTSYTDTSGISSQTRHSYQVAAVNYDGVQGVLSLAVSLSAVGIVSVGTSGSTSVLVAFTEPVDPASAQLAGNYQISGGVTVTAAVLQSDNRTVLLTTSALGTASYTLTVSNVKTRAGAVLPALTSNFTYSPLPAATSVDIGSPGVPGSSNFSAGAWTLTGGGGDVWDGTDQCQYLYVPATTSSPAVWIAHIASLTGNSGDSGWSKAGIMARAGTSALVADAFTAETSGNGVAFQWTSGTGTAPNNSADAGTSSPQWLEMTYDGNGDFNSYYSNSASATPPTTWTQLGTQENVPMPAGGFDVGLFITAHNNSATSTAVFDYNSFLAPGLGGGYTAPPFTVTVNPLATNNPSPAVSGTCSDPAASLSVRVNGNWYGVANNNGAWTLPAGDIPALASGTYDVAVCGVNTTRQVAFDSTLNELTVDTVSPTVTLQNVAAQSAAISSLGITFSEPVSGFSLQDLQLTLNGISLPVDGTTLTSSDDQHWTLGNLSGLTGTSGTYSLTVSDAGWGVADAAGNVLATSATTSWIAGPTVATPASAAPNAGRRHDGRSFGAGSRRRGRREPDLRLGGHDTARRGRAASFQRQRRQLGEEHDRHLQPWQATYGFTVTISDPGGLTATSSVNVIVSQTQTTIRVNGSPLVATACDQFGNPLVNQPVFDASSDTITGPLALASNVTLLPAASPPLTISGPISGTGSLTVGNAGTVVLSGANSYTGGTTVAAGTLVVTQSSAIAASTSLTVGAGGVFIFDPSFGGTLSAIVAAATPAITSSADTTTASIATSGVTSAATAAAVATNVVWSSLAALAPTAGVANHHPSGRSAESPIVPPADLQPRQSGPAGVLDARSADQIAGSSMPSPHTPLSQSREASRGREWAWLGQSASSSDNSDQRDRKDIAIQALETVFAQYGP